MEKEKAYQTLQELATFSFEFEDKLIEYFKQFSDQELKEIQELCKDWANGINEDKTKSCIGFRSTYYDDIARIINGDLNVRKLIRDSREFEKRTGITSYCATCQKDCDGDESPAHIEYFEKRKKTTEEMRLNEMSRADLIKEILQMQEDQRFAEILEKNFRISLE